MRRFWSPLPALLLLACPGGADDKESGVGTDTAADACAIAPGACDEDGDTFKPSEGDCDDNNSEVNPGVDEVCDGIDNNCDGTVDEGVTTTYYADTDGDGFGDAGSSSDACEPPTNYVANDQDCNDALASAYPGAIEVCDGVDNDCDGVIDNGVTTTFYADADGDGYGDPTSATAACEAPPDYVLDNTDCDDSTEDAYPGHIEICDTVDNDCDGTVDEGVTTTYYADIDDDGYGNPAMPDEACSTPIGYADTGDDCDDRDADVHPFATEWCNGIDDNCDGTIDESTAEDAATWYADTDADGYGDAGTSMLSCDAPTGFVADSTDCDDARYETNPGATEYCNGIDDDCDGTVDEGDAIDAATWYADVDNDGYGDSATMKDGCSAPSGYVSVDGDCNDRDDNTYPGAPEVCDGEDNDCNGIVDDNPTDGDTYYADTDADEFGDPSTTMDACAEPSGYTDNAYDCNDADASEPVVADAYGGSSTGDGSAFSPYSSLQDAIDQALECVVALRGTYSETVDLSGKSLDVWGVEGSGETTIDASLTPCNDTNPTECAAAVSIASGGGSTPTLHGFTITGGTGAVTATSSSETCADSTASHGGASICTVTTYNYCGGGIFVDGDDPAFEDLIVEENTLPAFAQISSGDFSQTWMYSFGGGICVADGNVQADDLWVTDNWADEGGGIYLGSTGLMTLTHGMIAENGASDGAGVSVAGGTFAATNAVIACNASTTDGGGVFGESAATLTLENVSLFGNTSDTSGSARGADVWMPGAASVFVVNSIVENDIASALLYGSGSATLEYNNVYNDNAAGSGYGGTYSAGTGSISMGSNFGSAGCDGNPNNDDWSLASGSASFDGGNPASAYNDVDGTTNDGGAYGGPGGDW